MEKLKENIHYTLHDGVLVINDNVEQIPDGGFGNMKIKSVYLPSDLKTIGAHAFAHNLITHIKFPKNSLLIGAHAFAYNLIESLEISETDEYVICAHAFAHNNISKLVIKSPNTQIYSWAFHSNEELRQAFVHENIHIPGNTFDDTVSITRIISTNTEHNQSELKQISVSCVEDFVVQNIKCKQNTTLEFCKPGITISNSHTHYDLNNFVVDDVNIQHIAHSLSHSSRYNGHCIEFYSIAQHCVRIAETVLLVTGDFKRALAALLHDAAECYIGDVVYPLKKQLGEHIKKIETKIERVIYEKFDILDYFGDKFTKSIDNNISYLEMETLLNTDEIIECSDIVPQCGGSEFVNDLWHPEKAEALFISYFNYLMYSIQYYSAKECYTNTHNKDLKE